MNPNITTTLFFLVGAIAIYQTYNLVIDLIGLVSIIAISIVELFGNIVRYGWYFLIGKK